MKQIRILIIFLLPVLALNSQTWAWAKSAVSSGTALTEALAVSADGLGNVFAAGYYYPPTLTFGTTTITNAGHGDGYFVKYNSSGNVLWARSVGDSSFDECNSVSTDGGGNSFISGSFQSSTITLGTYTLNNVSSSADVFLAKYDANGNVLWARSHGGTNSDVPISTNTDAAGNIYITGYFQSPAIAFGTYTLTNASFSNVFVAKYDPGGNVLWAKCAGGQNQWNVGTSVSTDPAGNVFLTGYYYSSTISFGAYTLTNAGSCNTFLVKYDVNGNVLWAKNAGGTTTDVGYSVSSDASGNAYLIGGFTSPTISFGASTLTNSGNFDAFFVKYDANGNVQWAKKYGGTGYDEGYSVSTYSTGLYITGGFSSPAISIDSYTLTQPPGSVDPMFIAKYDLSGNLIYATALSSGGDGQNAVSADLYGNAYISGDFKANPFAIGTTTLTITSLGSDFFIAKINFQPEVVKNISGNAASIVFPNPNNGNFSIMVNYEIRHGKMILFNSLGQVVCEQNLYSGENIVAADIARGFYHYVIFEDDRQVNSGKIAVE